MNSPPGTPSPVGNSGFSCGSTALFSPSNRLPTGSTMESETVSVKRSSGKGSTNTRVTEAVAGWFGSTGLFTTITDWMGITPLASPTSR